MRDPARPTADPPALALELLGRAASYDAIARELGVERDVARRLVRRAVEAVVTDAVAPPSAGLRGQIVDYLLGEQTLPQRMQTRSALDRSAADRAWANEARLALAVVLQATPAAIPDPVTGPIAARRKDATGPGSAPAAPPSPPVLALQGERISRRGAHVVTPEQARRRRRTAAAVLAVFAVALVIVLAAIGGSSRAGREHLSARARSQARRSGHNRRSGPATTVQHLRLTATGAQPKARAVAAIVHQGDGLLLLLQGHGLAANDGTYYAVWLYNGEVDNELLGLVSPRVGAAGTFASGATLPDDAVRFHELVVTLETTDRPSRPGRLILSSPLSVQ